MKLNFYNHFKDQQTRMAELDEIVNRILHDDVLRAQTDLYRAKRLKELKQQTPLFGVAARMKGGKAKDHVKALTGLTLVDVDELSAEQAMDVRRRAALDEHTLMAYVTISGGGVRIVCRYELPDASMPLEVQLEVTVQFSPNLENSTDYMIVNLQNKIAILLDLTLLN